MEYRGLTLDAFQAEAITHIERGSSVLVAAPTGTGKTLIADYLVEHVLNDGGTLVYTAPIKALSNQKYREYCRLVGADKVGLITGDIVINPTAPLRIMTTEILRNILLQRGVADPAGADGVVTAGTARMDDVDDIRAVIVDEIHFIDDADRGTVWEELLIYLPSHIRILGLSATLSNLQEFSSWLSDIRGTKVEVVLEETRAVPLKFWLANEPSGLAEKGDFEDGFRRWKKEQKKESSQVREQPRRGRGRGRRGRSGARSDSRHDRRTSHEDIVRALGSGKLPALYFIYSRKLTEKLAISLSRSDTGGRIASRARRPEIDAVLRAFDVDHPGVLRVQTRKCLQRGIAYHHAGMHVALKALVEELYEKRLVEVLYCTSTFALGINMPARTVIFDALTKFDGVDIVPLTVREFMQMAGRAGRRGLDTEGDVVVKMEFGDWSEGRPVFELLVKGRSEPVQSSFNLSFNSVVNLMAQYDRDQIRLLLERSFLAFQNKRLAGEIRDELAGDGGGRDRDARRRRARLERELVEAERPVLWDQFQRKVSFLRRHGYLGADDSLNSSAKILQKIQFTEIFVTELILGGVVERLSAAELFGVFTGLVQTLPRTARVREPEDEKWWEIFDAVGEVFKSDIVYDSQFLSNSELVFVPPLMPLGERWAHGDSLAEILREISNPTDLSGDLVGAFRRAKDLVGQVRQVYWEDTDRRAELGALLREVSRDEVEVVD